MGFDGQPHGGFYTQDDVREIVAYARARFVTIVPRSRCRGIPGGIAAIRSSATAATPFRVDLLGGGQNILNPADPTIQFAQTFSRSDGLFPGPWIHTGGDEAPKAQWKGSPLAQARIRGARLEGREALQGLLHAPHGRVPHVARAPADRLGRDPRGRVGAQCGRDVLARRGRRHRGGPGRARRGHGAGVHIPTSIIISRPTRPASRSQSGLPAARTGYAFEPVPPPDSSGGAVRARGPGTNCGPEYIPDPKRAEYMVYPEPAPSPRVLWTPREQRNYADFSRRLATHLERLAGTGCELPADGELSCETRPEGLAVRSRRPVIARDQIKG